MGYRYVCLVLLSHSIFGQSVFKGNIKATNQSAISGINVTLHLPNSSAILAFAITDKQGRYAISYNSIADTLLLKVYGMGYATQQIKVQNKTQEIDFELSEQHIELKEVVVKESPITRRGDTLSYSVGAFKNQNDRSISDLIKRLPGIEVEASGRILYQGKPINKYYIEGMDLLEGKYSLANENLPVDAVSQVEVFENHQPIRMLDSLVFSDNAALNIRLKNKVATTGMARLGTGMTPLLWDANVTPMVFTQKNQLIASYQTNNVGNNVAKQIRTLTKEDFLSPFENDNAKKTWVQIIPLATPSFADARWLRNAIQLGSFNFLKKINNGYELRANLSYLNDCQQQQGHTQTINYTPTDTIRLLEDKRNRFGFNRLETKLTLQKNDKGKYFKNQLTFKGQWDEEQGMLLRNNNQLSQRVKSPFFSLTNQLRDIFKMKNEVLTFQSFTDIQRSPQSLTVVPGQFADLLNNRIAFDSLRQATTVSSFYTNNRLSLNKSIRSVSFSPQVGIQVKKQLLESQIERPSGEGEFMVVSDEFKNKLQWTEVNYYAQLETQYRRRLWKLTLNTPLHFYNFWIEDRRLKQEEEIHQFTFEPQLKVSYDAGSFWTLSGSIDRKNTFGEIDGLFYGYMLRNYRTVERRNAPLLKNVSLGGSLNARYRNPLTSIFGYVTYSKRLTDNNLIYGVRITPQATTESYALTSFNTADFQLMMMSVGKYFKSLKTQLNIDYQLSISARQQIINGAIVAVKNQNSTRGIRLTTKLKKWADLEYSYKQMGFQNQLNNQRNQPASQQQHQLNINLYPFKNGYVGFQNELYNNRFVAMRNRNLFSDLVLRYTLSKQKIDVETNWINIWNTSSLSMVSTNAFSYSESTYQLRPMQIMLRVRFSF